MHAGMIVCSTYIIIIQKVVGKIIKQFLRNWDVSRFRAAIAFLHERKCSTLVHVTMI